MESYDASSSGSEAETSANTETPDEISGDNSNYQDTGADAENNEKVSENSDREIQRGAIKTADGKKRDGDGETDPSGKQRTSAANFAPGLRPDKAVEAAELAQLQKSAAAFELQGYVRALGDGLAGVNAPMAAAAIENYKLSGNPADLAAVKQFFPPETVVAISADSAQFQTQQAQHYDVTRKGRQLSGVTQALYEFEQQVGRDWFKEPWRGDVIAEAVRLAGEDISLPKVKKLLDAVEAGAVAKFKAEMRAEAENRSQTARLQSPTGNYAGGSDDEDWHSIKDIETMNRKVLKFYEERNKCL